jgi:gas vesicle protein
MAAGAIIGGIAGFVAGMEGFDANKKSAQEYLANTVTPKIDSAMQKYYDGQESYDQAQREIAALEVSEGSHFGKWGKAGSEIWQDDGRETFGASASLLLHAEEAGRGDVPRGTSEFHSGGYVAGFGFGDLGNDEGLAKLKRGEFIVDADTTAAYRPALESLSSSKTMPMRPASSGGAVHLHVHALDLKDFRGYLRAGGAQEVNAALNNYQGDYAGESDQN